MGMYDPRNLETSFQDVIEPEAVNGRDGGHGIE